VRRLAVRAARRGSVCGARLPKLNLDPDKVRHGGQTTDDGQFTVETVTCIAGCHHAPLAQIDLDYFENLDEKKFDEIVTRLRNERAHS